VAVSTPSGPDSVAGPGCTSNRIELDHDFTVTVRGDRLVALHAQPTFTLGSERASELVHLSGKASAVNGCAEIPAPRRTWLASEFRRLDTVLRTDGLHLLSFNESRPGSLEDD
jgi:hypothetical protein